VLYGDVNPSARLPVTIPNIDNEIQFTEEMYPGVGVDNDHTFATYSEELLIGYRWYNANGVTPKFAFGHGLSYTTFDYGAVSAVSDHDDDDANAYTVTVDVSNKGGRSGAEVVQLYVSFPSEAQEPPYQLRGISKLDLDVSEQGTAAFALTSRDFSIWDTTTHDWSVVNGTFTVSVGSASDNLKSSTTIVIG
jgi:beta-glucosidase